MQLFATHIADQLAAHRGDKVALGETLLEAEDLACIFGLIVVCGEVKKTEGFVLGSCLVDLLNVLESFSVETEERLMFGVDGLNILVDLPLAEKP